MSDVMYKNKRAEIRGYIVSQNQIDDIKEVIKKMVDDKPLVYGIVVKTDLPFTYHPKYNNIILVFWNSDVFYKNNVGGYEIEKRLNLNNFIVI